MALLSRYDLNDEIDGDFLTVIKVKASKTLKLVTPEERKKLLKEHPELYESAY